MEAITQPDQGQSDDMMQHQLLEILPRLLQHEQQDQTLLSPVTGLKQVVCLEQAFMRLMREVLKHGSCVEIPHRGAAHDIQTERTVDTKV